jgi:TIR domain
MNFRRRIIRGDYAKPSAFDLMADIFVSYAKTDRSLALKLAAMLEAEGWKVWWDTSLTIGDDFRNEIMTELGRARAVIVIWTDTSIKSDWVRSEAGRAQADRKLIPVKVEHLTYKDLPPPFDVLHTENVGEEDKIKAAVVAQLAKPAVEPSPLGVAGEGPEVGATDVVGHHWRSDHTVRRHQCCS